MRTYNHLVLDVETTTSNKGNPFDQTNKLCYIGLKDNILFDIEYTDSPYKNKLNEVQNEINKVETLVGFNIKFDLHWLKRYGINFNTKRIWDCQLVHFILSGQKDTYPSLNKVAKYYNLDSKIDTVAEEYWKNDIDTTEIPEDILQEYLQKDLELTEQIYQKQLVEVTKKQHLIKLISLHNQDLLVLQEMEFNGLLFDEKWSEVLANELDEQIGKLDKSFIELHNCVSFNPSSNDHISALLYGGLVKFRNQVPAGNYKTGKKAGLPKFKWKDEELILPRLVTPLKGSELKKEGYYSTDERTLKSLKGSKKAMEIINLILTRSGLVKKVSTYYRGLVSLIKDSNWNPGTIHGQLNQCVARTGRLSSSKPNLQNFDGDIKGLFKSRYKETDNE